MYLYLELFPLLASPAEVFAPQTLCRLWWLCCELVCNCCTYVFVMNGTFLWTTFCALLPLEMKVVWVLFVSGLASFLLSQHRPFYPCLAMHVPFAQQRCLQQLATPLEYTPTVYPPRTPSPTVYTRGTVTPWHRPHFSPASFADWFRPTPVPGPQRRKAKT